MGVQRINETSKSVLKSTINGHMTMYSVSSVFPKIKVSRHLLFQDQLNCVKQ